MKEKYREEVGAILFNEKNEFLVLNAKSYKANNFSIPKGGKLQLESDIDCIKRELLEELGRAFSFVILKQSSYEKISTWPEEIQIKDGRSGAKLKLFFIKTFESTIDFNKDEINEIKWLSKGEFWQLLEEKQFDTNILISEFNTL